MPSMVSKFGFGDVFRGCQALSYPLPSRLRRRGKALRKPA